MANRLYNKQVSPKGYKAGGKVLKDLKSAGVISDKVKVKDVKKILTGTGRAKKMGGGMMMQRPMMKKGGSLKPVQPNQKGLSKLPTEVRNKMGYMKKGGVVSDAKKKQFKANQAGQKSFNKKFGFEGDYKGKSLAGKAKEFVKTAAKQHIRAAKKIAKGISGGAKK